MKIVSSLFILLLLFAKSVSAVPLQCSVHLGAIFNKEGKIASNTDLFFPNIKKYNDIFRNACVQHDLCYRHGYATYDKSKASCDVKFLKETANTCHSGWSNKLKAVLSGGITITECLAHSSIYYTGVKFLGGDSYKTTDSTYFEYEKSKPFVGVCLYQHSRYRGKKRCFPLGKKEANLKKVAMGRFWWKNWNDTTSSFRLYGPVMLKLYKHSNFGGYYKTFTSSQRHLGAFNDELSSIKVSPINPTGCFYEHSKYRGNVLCLPVGSSHPDLEYNRMHNKISSVFIKGPVTIKMYNSEYYKDKSATLKTSKYHSSPGWQDNVESVEVLDRVSAIVSSKPPLQKILKLPFWYKPSLLRSPASFRIPPG